MAAFLIDLDDTLVHHGTNQLLDGAMDFLKSIKAKGHQLIITTRRGDEWSSKHVYGKQSTETFLRSLDVEIDQIVYGVTSPRIVVNDGGAIGVTHPAGEPVKYIVGDDSNPIFDPDANDDRS
jgi:ribonucleotide monophosphatase NagD (HAD superfamily)